MSHKIENSIEIILKNKMKIIELKIWVSEIKCIEEA
jgi:hypothetical protein